MSDIPTTYVLLTALLLSGGSDRPAGFAMVGPQAIPMKRLSSIRIPWEAPVRFILMPRTDRLYVITGNPAKGNTV